MKLAVFADEGRQEVLRRLLLNNAVARRLKACIFYKNYDDFIINVPNSGCDTVIIAHKGAVGMQGIRAARVLLNHVPLVWFSDDCGFLEESYRLGCAYFSSGTITETVLQSALDRCE